jgi:hypothetical protein
MMPLSGEIMQALKTKDGISLSLFSGWLKNCANVP